MRILSTLLLLFISCKPASTNSSSYDTVRRTVYKYDTVRRTIIKDTIVYKYKTVIKQVPVKVFIPAGFEQNIKDGIIKYTITYK